MTTTSGAGVFGFFGRIFGTVVAMVTSLIIWYIVVGHAAGVIVFLFLFTFVEFYIILKYPRIIVIAIISIVTQGESIILMTWMVLMVVSLDHWLRAAGSENRN